MTKGFSFAVVLAGCATATITGNHVFETQSQQIQKGVTTRDQVIALLGNSAQVIYPSEGKEIMLCSLFSFVELKVVELVSLRLF